MIDRNILESNILTSAHNPKVKKLLVLQQKSAERRRDGLFVVEGMRELTHCINSGMRVSSVFCCVEKMSESDVSMLCDVLDATTTVFSVPAHLYERIAYRGSTEGVIAEIVTPDLGLNDLTLSKVPLIVVLESVEKPGNLGAILRSADAAGVDAVIVCDPLTDIYNPNLIRSSVGAVFTVPCVACSSEECISYLKQHNIKILTAQLQDSRLYYDTDMSQPVAIVMGTEATGLTSQWRVASDAHIRIPMLGSLDSLNVSVSAAILMYEAIRQRR